MTVGSNGDVVVDYALEKVTINQHKKRWLPANKRQFTKELSGKAKEGRVSCK
jgi:hypothetical protein